MARAFADITFTPAVRAQQEKMGSARGYGRLLSDDVAGGDRLSEMEIAFIEQRNGFYQSSVTETGWPYVQFKGGPTGFLKVLDAHRIAYADYSGNRQYLSTGNLSNDGRVMLFLMDYANRARLKIWGRAELTEIGDDPDLINRLHRADYDATPERAVVITIHAVDWNCPQHIPQLVPLEAVRDHITALQQQVADLTAKNAQLTS